MSRKAPAVDEGMWGFTGQEITLLYLFFILVFFSLLTAFFAFLSFLQGLLRRKDYPYTHHLWNMADYLVQLAVLVFITLAVSRHFDIVTERTLTGAA